MSYPGRGAKATAAQRSEVQRLRAAGVSIRRIAEDVFGDRRLRGRVERILATPPRRRPRQANFADVDGELDVAARVRQLRELFDERMRFLRECEEPPSMNELQNMGRLLQLLDSLEQLERARERRRQRGSGASG